MEHFGLSWSEYEQTPDYVVDRMVERLNALAKRREAEARRPRSR